MSDPSPSSGPVSADSAVAAVCDRRSALTERRYGLSRPAYLLILSGVLAFPALGAASGARAKASQTFERAVAQRAQLEPRPDRAPIGDYLQLLQAGQPV